MDVQTQRHTSAKVQPMDIEKFDHLYPTPAHAAAADLRDRYAPEALRIEPRRLSRNRAGAISVVVGLAAALFGGAAYLLDLAVTSVPNYAVYADVPPRGPSAVVQQPVPAPALISIPADRPARLARHLATPHKRGPSPTAFKSQQLVKSSSKWIAEPLSGDALVAALIVDHRRTVELNAEQLRLMAEDKAKTVTKAVPVVAVPSDL